MSYWFQLSDTQLDQVMRLAQPLPVGLRAAFLERLAAELGALAELGDGTVYRIARQIPALNVDSDYFRPDLLRKRRKRI
jgi:hypothetical protein